MNIWLIQTGEPLPIDSPNARLFRTGMLAERLLELGHEVVWWNSTASHADKRQRADRDTVVELNERYRIRLVKAPVYCKNVSIKRVMAHRQIAEGFERLAPSEPRPDLIVSGIPTIEVSAAAARFARKQNVPLVLDIRDLWPDLILDLAPTWARGAAQWVLKSMINGMREACAQATAIMGTTDAFVDHAIGYSGRPRRLTDRAFPMAYTAREPSADALESARRFWDERGLADETRDSNHFVACFFGAMGRQSEIHTVIEAARRLRNQGRDMRFVLCGTGDRLKRYQKLAEGLDNVLLPGWVGAAEIWTLMRRSHVGLAPYRNIPNYVNGLPNKPVEYFSAALPVLTGLRGVLSDLLERHDCGLTYRFGDADDLAQTLEQLADDHAEWERMSRNAERLYLEQFTADAIFHAMADYLESLHVERTVSL